MKIDGVELNVEVDGEGPAVVLINGAFCTLRQWDLVVADLADEFRLIRHDIRGAGQSGPGPDDAYSFERYADDIVAVLDELGEETAVVWGMAWGSRVALVAAARHPDRFTQVVLGDLGIDPADTDAQKAGAQAAKAARAEAGIEEIPRPDGWRDHADFDSAAKAMRVTLDRPDLFPVVEEVTQPTLIATGEHDPNMASSERALGGLADGRLEVLPLTGHGSVMQRPHIVAEVVSAFLHS
jgi:pimeloyl-ACP methyl ester carboxylesterase